MTRDVLVTLGVLLAAGLVARSLATLSAVPEILILVGFGAVLGPHVTSIVDVPSQSMGAQLVFTLGVSAILFYGGLNLSLEVLRKVATSLGLLVLPGVALTALITGTATHLAFDLPWDQSLLIGAVLSPTDPAILIPLFVRARLRPKVSQTVIAESAFNDPTGAVLALTLASRVLGGGTTRLATPWPSSSARWRRAPPLGSSRACCCRPRVEPPRRDLARVGRPSRRSAMVTISYVSLDSAGGSGYLGAFLAGLIVGNMEMLGLRMHDRPCARAQALRGRRRRHRHAARVPRARGQPPDRRAGRSSAPAAWRSSRALLLVARPITVLACTLPDRRARWSRPS